MLSVFVYYAYVEKGGRLLQIGRQTAVSRLNLPARTLETIIDFFSCSRAKQTTLKSASPEDISASARKTAPLSKVQVSDKQQWN